MSTSRIPPADNLLRIPIRNNTALAKEYLDDAGALRGEFRDAGYVTWFDVLLGDEVAEAETVLDPEPLLEDYCAYWYLRGLGDACATVDEVYRAWLAASK